MRLTGAQIILRQRRRLVPVAIPLLLVHADADCPDIDTHRGRRPLQPLPAQPPLRTSAELETDTE